MGSGGYSSRDFTTFASSRKYDDPTTKTKDIYRRSSIDETLDPLKFRIRESVDGPDNPESTPLILGLDVTGSMDPVLDSIARKGLKTICEEIYNRKPITNPHICALGIGDVECDISPFQATQFEADIRIFEQLEKIWLEGHGGGNDHESYILAWYFAIYRVKSDSFAKRGKKGFIFTIGDEEITPAISAENIKKHMGDAQARNFSAEELFTLACAEWNIYHIIIKEGNHASRYFNDVKKSWENIIGVQRTIPLDDHTKAGEVIVSVLELASGKQLKEVADSWDADTSRIIRPSLKSVEAALAAGPAPKAIGEYL